MLLAHHRPSPSTPVVRLGSLCTQKPAATNKYVRISSVPFSQLLVPSCTAQQQGRPAGQPSVHQLFFSMQRGADGNNARA
jgi:hypothetical protein